MDVTVHFDWISKQLIFISLIVHMTIKHSWLLWEVVATWLSSDHDMERDYSAAASSGWMKMLINGSHRCPQRYLNTWMIASVIPTIYTVTYTTSSRKRPLSKHMYNQPWFGNDCKQRPLLGNGFCNSHALGNRRTKERCFLAVRAEDL
jgi:hypothetical protein